MRKTKHFERVTEFHKAFDLPVGTVKVSNEVSELTKFDAGRVILRERLISEEYEEVMSSETNVELLKEMADLVYVILGACVEFGWNFDEAFRRVHESNMSKLDPETGKPIYRADGKVLKSSSYKPADLSDLVTN